MNLRQVTAFRTIMLRGSMTAAAQELRTSQPSISRLIAELEDVDRPQAVRAEGRPPEADRRGPLILPGGRAQLPRTGEPVASRQGDTCLRHGTPAHRGNAGHGAGLHPALHPPIQAALSQCHDLTADGQRRNGDALDVDLLLRHRLCRQHRRYAVDRAAPPLFGPGSLRHSARPQAGEAQGHRAGGSGGRALYFAVAGGRGADARRPGLRAAQASGVSSRWKRRSARRSARSSSRGWASASSIRSQPTTIAAAASPSVRSSPRSCSRATRSSRAATVTTC